MRPVNEIIIHCTATRPGWWKDKTAAEKTAELRRWHVEDRNWSDIGYHYTIDRSGEITKGRSMERNGAHTKGRNKNTVVSLCLVASVLHPMIASVRTSRQSRWRHSSNSLRI